MQESKRSSSPTRSRLSGVNPPCPGTRHPEAKPGPPGSTDRAGVEGPALCPLLRGHWRRSRRAQAHFRGML